MQALSLISRSLRLLRVIDAEEAPEAKEAQDALDALNSMLCRWEADNISLGWSEISSVNDQLPLPPEAIQPVVFNLCMEIADEYGVIPSVRMERKADEGLSKLRRDVKVSNPIVHDDCGWGYDIRSDSYYGGRP